MAKRKFVLTKHTKRDGTYYYTCKVIVEIFRKPINTLEILIYGNGYKVPFDKEYYLNESGFAYTYEHEFQERETALAAIDLYIQRKEKEDGEKVISKETEIIYR